MYLTYGDGSLGSEMEPLGSDTVLKVLRLMLMIQDLRLSSVSESDLRVLSYT